MQKTLFNKSNNSKNSPALNAKKVTFSDIENFYFSKNNYSPKIGLEYERLSLDKNTLKNADYDKVSKIISGFCEIMGWKLVYDNNTIIGAKSVSGTSISLEPGCQLEISLAPKENIVDISIELSKITSLLDKIAKVYNVIFLGYGISPKVSCDEIELLNKSRYKIMDEYLPYCSGAEFCRKMMRKTAGMQVNIDYKDSLDAYSKLKFFNLIMPFVCALFANSPIEEDDLTGYKTSRANVWLYTGRNRCNFFYEKIFNKFFKNPKNIFKDYINCILDVPMVYIERNCENIPIRGEMNFREFMKLGCNGNHATIEDYILHQSLCFPDVRLKNYIEIRNHDSSTPQIALSMCAFYKGLLSYDFSDLLKQFRFLQLEDLDEYNSMIVENGLDFKIYKSISAWDVVIRLLKLSLDGLSSKERMYLEPLAFMAQKRKTQADEIIQLGIDNARRLVDYLY